MNERNINALATLLAKEKYGNGYVEGDEANVRRRAEFLASNGVLVPEALTDEELLEVDNLPDLGMIKPRSEAIRYVLNRWVKGDDGA